MEKSYRKGLVFFLAVLLVGSLSLPVGIAADEPSMDENLMEELGIESGSSNSFTPAKANGPAILGRAGGVLLIPESTNDTVGMYDPNDGTHLGDLIVSAGELTTPINAILGPDGNIYLSDQSADAVLVYDTSGNYLSTYADSTDGLDNVRGISFRGDHLFVCTYHGEVAEFDGPHSRLPDFIFDAGNVSMWDILFLAGGDCLVNNSSSDTCKHYDASGVFIADVLSPVDFPEQVQFDLFTPGEYLINVFTDHVVHDFDIAGTIYQTTPHGASGRGVFRLGNGNLLITSSAGVQEIDPVTGAVIQTENTGSARFIELLPDADSLTVAPDTISASTGGSVSFGLDAGSALANKNYLIVGSVTGTSPGTPLPGGTVLPVNFDVFTNVTINLAGSVFFPNSMGNLDGNGQATAGFDTINPLPASTVGLVMYFAFPVPDKPAWFASNAVSVTITN